MASWNERLQVRFRLIVSRQKGSGTYEDRCIDDAKSADVLDGQVTVNNFADLSSTGRVAGCGRALATVFHDTLDSGGIGRVDEWADDVVLPWGRSDISLRRSHSLYHDSHIVVRRQESRVNQRLVKWVTGVEPHVAAY